MSTDLATWLSDLAVWDADLNLDDDVACRWQDCDAAADWRFGFTCLACGRCHYLWCDAHAGEVKAALRTGFFFIHDRRVCGKHVDGSSFTWGRL